MQIKMDEMQQYQEQELQMRFQEDQDEKLRMQHIKQKAKLILIKKIEQKESSQSSWLKKKQFKPLQLQIRKEETQLKKDTVVLCEDEKYPGVVVVKNQKIISKKISCERQELDYREDMGISVLIPEDSVSPDESLDMVIQPSFSGSFEMPEDTEPASPAYLIEISKETELRKAIIVRMQHYASLESDNDCKDMVFLRANSDPEYRGSNPVYVFKEVEGIEVKYRVDDAGYQVGEIALKQFCWLRIGKKANEIKKLYSARLYKSLETTKVTAVFCMCPFQTCYTQFCDEYITSHYTGMTCKADSFSTYSALKITSDIVTLVKEERVKCIMDKSKISKAEIDLPEEMSMKADEIPDYPPRIFITCTGSGAEEAEFMTLRIKGLDEECKFEIPIPITTPTSPLSPIPRLKVNTELLQKAKASLERKVSDTTRTLTESSDLLICIRMIIDRMKKVEVLVHDPSSMESLVETVEQIQIQIDIIVRSTENTKSIEREIFKVITTSQQLKIGTMAKLKHCEDEGDWLVAVDMLVSNVAELMSCIEEMLEVAERDEQFFVCKDDIDTPISADDYISTLPDSVRPFLEKQLDWDNEGVDKDLNTIADHMLDWEVKLSTQLELKYYETSTLKRQFKLENPVLLQRAVLRKWKEKKGLHCTYGNLLKACCEGGDTHTAEAICKVLKQRMENQNEH